MSSSSGVTRRAVLAGAGALAAAGARPAAAATVRRLAEPTDGTAAAEVIGEVAQDDNALMGYGYFTRVHGLALSQLFGAARSEESARLTFFGTAAVGERFPHGALVSVTGRGTLSLHLGDGADFATPATFGDGPVVAVFDARYQNVAAVVAPNEAVTTLQGELMQRRAPEFRLGGRRYRFGHPGLRLHLTATGVGNRTNAAPPRALFDVAGRLYR
jgi:hypothetical protein